MSLPTSRRSLSLTAILPKTEAGDVSDFKVSLPGQYATFTTQPDKEDAIFQKMSKTGKATHKWDTWAKENADEVKELEKKEAEEAAKAE